MLGCSTLAGWSRLGLNQCCGSLNPDPDQVLDPDPSKGF
jgi:hypothetical protein